MDRMLAHIERIASLTPIENADKIEVARILGWNTVVKKNEFKVGDLVAFFEIDSLLPVKDWSKFLDKNGKGNPIRLRTIKLRGTLSQGLAVPVSAIPELKEVVEGQDVTEVLGVEKWEPIIPACWQGKVRGNFPAFLRKTDEERIQNAPNIISEFSGQIVRGTLKMDGTSATYYLRDGEFGVCSRKLELEEDANNTYWKIAQKYGLKEKLLTLNRNLCIQGEICGPGIQGNKMGLKELELFVFNVYDVDSREYLSVKDSDEIIAILKLRPVPLLYEGPWKWESVDSLLQEADKHNYENHSPAFDSPAEGIVFRPMQEASSLALKGARLSIKAISNRFLLKYGE